MPNSVHSKRRFNIVVMGSAVLRHVGGMVCGAEYMKPDELASDVATAS